MREGMPEDGHRRVDCWWVSGTSSRDWLGYTWRVCTGSRVIAGQELRSYPCWSLRFDALK
jgi:hypothetical protein